MKSQILAIVIFALFTFFQSGPIEPPQVIGTPPQNAYTGLIKLDKGEIRHYGPGMYLRSTDQGSNWDTVPVSNGNHYGKKGAYGEYLRLYSGKNDSVFSLRSEGGIDGNWVKKLIDTNGAIMLKPAVFVNENRRALVAFHTRHRNGCGTYYSDDQGKTWNKSNQVQAPPHKAKGFHKGKRWNHGAVEPSVVELNNGKLWMLIRTAQDNHYESFSEDYGITWSEPVPSRFYGTITMPTIQRLQNGDLLFLWNNTTPLPETSHPGDYWEDVFTNRDVLHAALSKDEGKSWLGFREIYRNPHRNDSLMATRFGKMGSLDRSVHQTEVIEIDSNQIIIALGQHPEFRKLLKVDLRWLTQPNTSDDFGQDLSHWTHHNYLKGIEGHCAYNRKPGARLIKHPDQSFKKVMLLNFNQDSSVLHPTNGALYNFPASFNGKLALKFKLNERSKGFLISLHDRWFNPIDTVAVNFAMFNLNIRQNFLNADQWHELSLDWKIDPSVATGYCTAVINGKQEIKLPIENPTKNGLSYVHFLLNRSKEGNEGILIESIKTSSQIDKITKP